MELAKVVLMLGGQSSNTVIKENVTPAQMAMYAYMHGEACAQSLTITGVDKKRSVQEEIQRLRMEFTSEHSAQTLAKLFPGMHPQLPVTFRSIGFDPDVLSDHTAPVFQAPRPKNEAEQSIMQKIQNAEAERTVNNLPSYIAPVSPQDLTDVLDDTGSMDVDDDLDDNSVDFGDDPIDLEVGKMRA